MLRRAKVDGNQKQIVAALRKAGAYIIHLHQVKNAFDILVFFRGNIYPVEIKDGTLPPSKRKLTEGELECKKSIERHGCTYNIIESVEDALKLINHG